VKSVSAVVWKLPFPDWNCGDLKIGMIDGKASTGIDIANAGQRDRYDLWAV